MTQSSFPHARLLTYLCYAAMMSLAIGINLLPVFLTALSHLYGGAAGLTQEQLGRLGACAFGGLVAGVLITGPLADRFGAKLFAQLGNALIAVSLVASALAPSYGWLGASFVVLGFGSGLLDMVLSPVVAALNPERRAVSMNWLHSFYCVGAVVTIGVGALAMRFGWGWRGACFSLLPMPFALFVAFSFLRFPSMTTEGEARTPFPVLLRQHWFILAMAGIFWGGATELGMAQWLPAYAETSLGYPAAVGSLALLLFSVAMALGRMGIGVIGARFDPFQIMTVCCVTTTAAFLAGCFIPVPSLALVACIVAGLTGSALWPTMLAVTADRFPQGGASMFGALAALGNAGGIFMPWVVGAVADRSDLHWGLSVSALAPAIMCAILQRLRNPARSAGAA